MADFWLRDDTELEGFKWEHDGIVRAHRSINEEKILAANARIRSAGGAPNLTFGRPLLQMSLAQLEALKRRFPVLRFGSAYERSKKWKEIARDPEFRRLWLRD